MTQQARRCKKDPKSRLRHVCGVPSQDGAQQQKCDFREALGSDTASLEPSMDIFLIGRLSMTAYVF